MSEDYVSRATVLLKNGSLKMRTLQTEHVAGEVRDDIEHFEPYGFTSEPFAEAEAVTVSPWGDKDHTIAVVVADRRYRVTGLKDGEVCVHDDQGQKVYLTRSGIVISTEKPISVTGSAVTVKADSITMDSPTVTCTGKMQVAGDIIGQSQIYDSAGKMQSIRDTYNSHTHNGGHTPDQKM